MDNIDLDNLPEFGLRKIKVGDVFTSGKFVVQQRSGFLLVTAGSLEFADSERFYNLKRGDIYLYASNTHLYIKGVSGDMEGLVGVADMSYIMSITASLMEVDRVVIPFNMINPCISLSEKEMNDIGEIGDLLMRKTVACHSGIERQICNYIGRALCLQIALAYSSRGELPHKSTSREDQLVIDFLFSVQKHINEHHDVAFYADLQHLSTRYFSAVIKARTGRTAIEWIIDVVIAASKNLLSDNSLSIKEVGYRMGFPNPSFFGRYFRHYTGMSPGEYREAVARQRMGSSY